MGIFRLGFITVYLSDPLISGFTTGAACHVFTSQIKHVFAIKTARYSGAFKLINVSTLCVSCLRQWPSVPTVGFLNFRKTLYRKDLRAIWDKTSQQYTTHPSSNAGLNTKDWRNNIPKIRSQIPVSCIEVAQILEHLLIDFYRSWITSLETLICNFIL